MTKTGLDYLAVEVSWGSPLGEPQRRGDLQDRR